MKVTPLRIIQGAHNTYGPYLRRGQFFCNYFLKDDDTVPGLYEADEQKSDKLIQRWLLDHQYVTHVPRPVRMKLVQRPGGALSSQYDWTLGRMYEVRDFGSNQVVVKMENGEETSIHVSHFDLGFIFTWRDM